MTDIPFTDFGGTGAYVHFLHANGYPPACYQPLMRCLTHQYHVSAMHLRPLWPGSDPNGIDAWQPLSDDYRLFQNQQKQNSVIAVGHSVGAVVLLRAALRDPARFKSLILIDPVIFQPSNIAAYNLIKAIGLANKYHPLISGALNRRRRFDNLEKLQASYRRKQIFRYFSDEALKTYIAGITRPAENDGFELVYSPEWEARIYYTGIWRDMDLWREFSSLKVPTLIIRGAETDTFLNTTAKRLKRLRPQTTFITIEKSTHLVPLEKPEETYTTMQNFLTENL